MEKTDPQSAGADRTFNLVPRVTGTTTGGFFAK